MSCYRFSAKRLIVKGFIALGLLVIYFVVLARVESQHSLLNIWWGELLIWPYMKVCAEIAFGNGYIGLFFFLFEWFIVFAALVGIEHLKKRTKQNKTP